MRKTVQNRYAVLIFGALTFVCIGVIYSWSKFSTSIRTDLGLDQAQVTLAYTICIAMFSIGIAFDGFLSKLCSVKVSVTLACFLVSIGYFATSLLNGPTRYLIYFVYGTLVGLGVGVTYGGWLSHIILWFPQGRGLTTGVLLTAIGFSGLTITPILAVISSSYNWRTAFRLMALLFLLISVFSRFFLTRPPKLPDPPQQGSPALRQGYPVKEVIRRREFWAFCIWKLLLLSVGQAFLGQLVPIIADIGGGDNIQLLCVSLVVFINGISRAIWGWFSDLFGYRIILWLIGILSVVSTAGLWYAIGYSIVPLAFASFLLFFSAFGGAISVGPGFVRTYYGQLDFRKNNGISSLTVFPGNLIVTSVIGLIRTSSGSYLPFFTYALPATVVATLMCFAIFSSKHDPVY